jgi:hypothetical protein
MLSFPTFNFFPDTILNVIEHLFLGSSHLSWHAKVFREVVHPSHGQNLTNDNPIVMWDLFAEHKL